MSGLVALMVVETCAGWMSWRGGSVGVVAVIGLVILLVLLNTSAESVHPLFRSAVRPDHALAN